MKNSDLTIATQKAKEILKLEPDNPTALNIMTQPKEKNVPFLVRYNKAKNALHSMNIKKNGAVVYGKNNFEYFELKDIIGAIDQVCETFNIAYSIDCQNCILTLFDALDPKNFLEFKTYNYSGLTTDAHTQQDPNKFEGGTNTYRRRYMLITAFNLEEPDGVEETVMDSKPHKYLHNGWDETPDMSTETIEPFNDEEFNKYLDKCRSLLEAISGSKQPDKDNFKQSCILNIRVYKTKFLDPKATQADKSSALHSLIQTHRQMQSYLAS